MILLQYADDPLHSKLLCSHHADVHVKLRVPALSKTVSSSNSLVEEQVGGGRALLGPQLFLELLPRDDRDAVVVTLKPDVVGVAGARV